jgi:hypothetical protein
MIASASAEDYRRTLRTIVEAGAWGYARRTGLIESTITIMKPSWPSTRATQRGWRRRPLYPLQRAEVAAAW